MVEIQYRNARIKLGNTDLVYEPAEDSFLLADAALKEAKPGMRILEIGGQVQVLCRLYSSQT